MKRILTVGACLLMAASMAHAATSSTFTGAGDGVSWTNAPNWDNGLPTAVEQARIADGSVLVDAAALAGGQTMIGRNGSATLTVNSTGVLTSGKISVTVGNSASGPSALIVDGGTVNIAPTFLSGDNSNLSIGGKQLGSVTVTNGGTINITGGNILVGDGYAATTHSMDVSGGSTVAITGGGIKVGSSAGSEGTLTVTDSTITSDANFVVGNKAKGTFILNSGSFTVDDSALNIASEDGTTAGSSVTINGGLLSIGNTINVGQDDAGSLTMNGGTILAGRLVLGNEIDGDSGTVSLLGGSMSITNTGENTLIFETAGSVLDIQNDVTLSLATTTNAYFVNLAINFGVKNGNITWDNGTSTLGGTYGIGDKTWENGTGSYLHKVLSGDQTIVWVDTVIPEPATLGLLGVGALAVFLRRRFVN